jgi:hypothetical protein
MPRGSEIDGQSWHVPRGVSASVSASSRVSAAIPVDEEALEETNVVDDRAVDATLGDEKLEG